MSKMSKVENFLRQETRNVYAKFLSKIIKEVKDEKSIKAKKMDIGDEFGSPEKQLELPFEEPSLKKQSSDKLSLEKKKEKKDFLGKTIKEVTLIEKSDMFPGSKELIITFNEISDPLKVIITKTGEVKFFFRKLSDII